MRISLPAAAPEPNDWRPRPTFKQRLSRATAVPAVAAATVFVAIVLVSIATVWLRPHGDDVVPEAVRETATEPGLALAAEEIGDLDVASVFVHVVGEVMKPGVYELSEGARVSAAIEAAGGATPEAALNGVNLARIMSDGEQLIVPNAEQMAAAPLGASGSVPLPGFSNGLINLNLTDVATLETLPRVGPALAQRILDWRESNGGFTSVDQLMNISGIGEKTFEQLRELVTI